MNQACWCPILSAGSTGCVTRILEQLKPRDFIEHMWVAEFIEGQWEAQRLRHYKSLIVTAARYQAVHNLLSMVLELRYPL